MVFEHADICFSGSRALFERRDKRLGFKGSEDLMDSFPFRDRVVTEFFDSLEARVCGTFWNRGGGVLGGDGVGVFRKWGSMFRH